MRAVRDIVVLVLLVTLATVGMRVLTWQPVQATESVISTSPTPIPDAGAFAYLQECQEDADPVQRDDCAFQALRAAYEAPASASQYAVANDPCAMIAQDNARLSACDRAPGTPASSR